MATITVGQDKDFLNIQPAIDAAQNGDTVLVSPGTYNERLTISGKTITLASEFLNTGDPNVINQTIIDGGGQTVINVASSAGPETKIIGFTIQNGDDGISPKAKIQILNNRIIGNVDGVDYEGGGGIARNNILENNSDDGIDLDGPVEAIIEDNIIRNNGDGSKADGIEIRLQPYTGPTIDVVIRNNIISGNAADGIQLIDYEGISNRSYTIEDNLIQGNGFAGVGLMDNRETAEDFRAASIPEPIDIINNTFVDNNYGLTGGDNLVALNNLFVNHTNIGIKGVNGSSIAAYNLFWNNGTDIQGSNVDNSTTLFADPLLDSNSELRTGSPAIDAGTAFFEWRGGTVLNLPSSSYNGSDPDLGAFENGFTPLTSIMVFPDMVSLAIASGMMLGNIQSKLQ